jgi:hypothetical protein
MMEKLKDLLRDYRNYFLDYCTQDGTDAKFALAEMNRTQAEILAMFAAVKG